MSEKSAAHESAGLGQALTLLIGVLFGTQYGILVLVVTLLIGGGAVVSCIEQVPKAWSGLPTVISTQQLSGKTIRDDASQRCFTVVQQDGAPRLVPTDCPKGK